MTEDSAPPRMTRREALCRAAALLGLSLGTSQAATMARALAVPVDVSAPAFLGRARFRCLEAVVDVLIPETGTPGAVSAGVPVLIDRLLAGWASAERQARYRTGLDEIDRRARADGAADFAGATDEQRTSLVRALDAEAYAPDADGRIFFRELKKMALFTYFSSEAGATIALRYQAIPGDYQPCLSLAKDDRAWFWLGFSYDL